MKIIKRNGAEESFDTLKIVNAVQKACNATENAYLAPEQLTDIADYVRPQGVGLQCCIKF